VIDTGTTHSLLSSDIPAQIWIRFENSDQLVRSLGIGGDEYSFQKNVDQIQLGDFIMEGIPVDFDVFMKAFITLKARYS
jgi:hypothetical protein